MDRMLYNKNSQPVSQLVSPSSKFDRGKKGLFISKEGDGFASIVRPSKSPRILRSDKLDVSDIPGVLPDAHKPKPFDPAKD